MVSSWFPHLDDISSYVGSSKWTTLPFGSTIFLGEFEAAYDAWGALRRIIVTGERLVHSNHILFLGISLLEWQWGHDVADVESGLRPFKTLGERS